MINIVVVIHNRACSMMPLLKSADAHRIIVVFDNSDSDLAEVNREYCDTSGIVYLGGDGNQGLSIAYNRSIDYLRRKDPSGHVCFLDDDSNLGEEFFRFVEQESELHPSVDVFLPILWANGKIVSPSLATGYLKCRLFKSKTELQMQALQNLTALNSGMVVKLSVYASFHYDERIFLEYLDHLFMMFVTKSKLNIKILDYEANHELSSYQRAVSAEWPSAYRRYLVFLHDTRLTHHRASFCVKVLKRGMKLTVLYKHPAFLRAALLGMAKPSEEFNDVH